jgi:hypothetical protein
MMSMECGGVAVWWFVIVPLPAVLLEGIKVNNKSTNPLRFPEVEILAQEDIVYCYGYLTLC